MATTMSIERAEQLKRELTDKWVVVASATPELRRFAEFTGKVKTVNMNCRALVQFDGSEDISWYDIDPAFLTVVDAPKPKKKAEHAEKPAAKAAPAAKPAPAGGSPLDAIRASAGGAAPTPKAAAGGSPLDKIRASAGGAAAAPAKKPAGGSPLDAIRASGAAKAGAAAAAEEPKAETAGAEESAPAAEAKKPATPTAGMSPLDLIRAQNAAKK